MNERRCEVTIFLFIMIVRYSLESFFKFIFVVAFAHFRRHHLQELVELNHSVVILIDFVDHVAEFRFCLIIKRKVLCQPKYKCWLTCILLFSSPVGRCPNERMTTANSANVIDPSSSLSNSMKTSLNSTFEKNELKGFHRHALKVFSFLFQIETLTVKATTWRRRKC